MVKKSKLLGFEIDCMWDYMDDGELIKVPTPVTRRAKAKIIDAEEIVTDREDITIRFRYPLHRGVDFEFHHRKGFTRKQFWNAINKGYHRIYSQEEAVTGDPGCIPGMYNRQTSDGPYGIWGHSIDQLSVEGVEEVEPGIFELSIGS